MSNLGGLGITTPTPVQAACIPKVLAGVDCIGTAQTGSGKTAAFAVPILQRLLQDPYGVFALVLTPTRRAHAPRRPACRPLLRLQAPAAAIPNNRELAHQIAEQFAAFGAGVTLNVLVAVGGEDMSKQARERRREATRERALA